MLELELLEVMGVAQGVSEGVALVAAKAFMRQRALILGDESKVFEGFLTSLAMNTHPGQVVPDEYVQPGRALGSQTAFIRPEDRALEEGFPDALIGLLQPGGRFADPVDHARSGRTQPAQALQNFAGAYHGNHVVVVERDGKSLESGAILNRGLERARAGSPLRIGALTTPAPDAMFGHFDWSLRKLKNLAGFVAFRLHRRLTGLAEIRERVINHVIRVSHLLKAVSRMALHSASRTLAGLAKAASLLAQAIARRGLRRVVTVPWMTDHEASATRPSTLRSPHVGRPPPGEGPGPCRTVNG